MARASAALSAVLSLTCVAAAHPLFYDREALLRLPERPVTGLPVKRPAFVVCWNASSRVMIAESSPYAGQAGDACATLDRDVCACATPDADGRALDTDDCVKDGPFVLQLGFDFGRQDRSRYHVRQWNVLMFDNGYANNYQYEDLAPCNKTGSAAAGSYLISQSAVIAVNASQGDVEAAVWLVLQEALYETTLKVMDDLLLPAYHDSLTYCKHAKRCNISVFASETNESEVHARTLKAWAAGPFHSAPRPSSLSPPLNTPESSPFGYDTVTSTNGELSRDPEMDIWAMWPSLLNGTMLWRVDYQIVAPTLRSALNVATLMQDVKPMLGLFQSAFEMVVRKRRRAVAVGIIALSRPSLQHLDAYEWQDAEQPAVAGEEESATLDPPVEDAEWPLIVGEEDVEQQAGQKSATPELLVDDAERPPMLGEEDVEQQAWQKSATPAPAEDAAKLAERPPRPPAALGRWTSPAAWRAREGRHRHVAASPWPLLGFHLSAFGLLAAIAEPAAAALACLLAASCALAAVLRRRRGESTATALQGPAGASDSASVEEGSYELF